MGGDCAVNTANPKLRLTKTDFARFLNVNSERFPDAVPYREVYMTSCSRARKNSIGQFGFWLRSNHSRLFNRLFKQASSRPDEILSGAYDSTDA